MPVKPAGGMGTLSSKLVNSLNVKGIEMICVANRYVISSPILRRE